MKYRKKPVVIEAFRFKIDDVMPNWFNEKRITNDIVTYDNGTCDIKTLEGTMKANFGDYVIRGVNGEVYPCKPDIFEKTYEKADEIIMPLDSIQFANELSESVASALLNRGITTKNKMNKLEELSKPIIDFLKENYDSYCTASISMDCIKVVRDES